MKRHIRLLLFDWKFISKILFFFYFYKYLNHYLFRSQSNRLVFIHYSVNEKIRHSYYQDSLSNDKWFKISQKNSTSHCHFRRYLFLKDLAPNCRHFDSTAWKKRNRKKNVAKIEAKQAKNFDRAAAAAAKGGRNSVGSWPTRFLPRGACK